MLKKIFTMAMAACAIEAQAQVFTLDDYLSGRYYPMSVREVRPMSDGEHFAALSRKTIQKYSYKTGDQEGALAELPSYPDGYELSGNESKILFYTGSRQVYRHSFLATYQVMDIESGECQQLYGEPQRDASLSSDGSMAAFIVSNNIFLKNLATGDVTQVTSDGQEGKVINGAPDWVYEEEFGFSKAYELSPCGKYLAYIKFNESDVKSFTLQYYPVFSNYAASDCNYPTQFCYKYPKAGESNSKVSVHIYNIETGETIEASLGPDPDIYVPRIQWIGSTGKLCICHLNRLQNKLSLLSLDPITRKTSKFFQMSDPKYIEEDVMKNILFINQGKEFIIISEQDGCRRLKRYDISGRLINNISPASVDVIEPYGYCPQSKSVFYKAVGDTPARTAIYSADISGSKVRLVSQRKGSNDAVFSADFNYFVSIYSSAQTPTCVSVCDSKGKQIRILEDNDAIKRAVDAAGGTRMEFFDWKNTTGQQLCAYMIKPPDFDPHKKYPVVVVGYNGPNSNEVNDEFSFGWEQVLSHKGFIVACTDARGTGRRGTAFRKCTYGRLGDLETKDLVDFAKYLGKQQYIDGERIGIWGWSYGGFMVSSVMTRGGGIYKAGIAVAPVESWEYYDNIYTERYMGLPKSNIAGYKDNSPIKYASSLEGKLLLVFGTADDNVHPQNSIAFINALERAGKDFDLLIYPNGNHGLYGPNNRRHLYTKAIKFLTENL